MKRLSKALLLLATLGFLVGCGGRTSPSNSDTTPSSGDESSEPAEIANVVLSMTSATVKVGEFVEVTASLSIPNEGATYTATADKTYAVPEVNGSTIKVSLTDDAVVGETATVIVASEGANSASLAILVDEKEVVETYYTVFFYQKYVSEEQIQTLQTEINTLLGASFDHVVYETLTDTTLNVKAAGQAVAAYNAEHTNKIDALLGFNGDSENTLAGAGYQRASEQNYTYGTDTSRKLWVATQPASPTANASLKEYLFAHYGPTKVNLSKASADLKPGERVTVTASLDVVMAEQEPVYTVSSDPEKAYLNIEVTGNSIEIYAATDSVVGDEIVITISCLTFTPATITIKIISQDSVKENHLVVAFYMKYVTDEKIAEIKTNFATYLSTNSITLDSVSYVELGTSGTNVVAFANLISSYNQNASNPHPINVLLGANGDSGDALANAGYKKASGTSYTYGTDTSRKIWVPKEYDADDPDLAVKAMIDFIAANYSVQS